MHRSSQAGRVQVRQFVGLKAHFFEREDTLPFLFGTIIFLFELHNAHDKECSKATLSTKWAHPFHRSLQTTPQKTLLLQGWNLWTKKSLFARKCSYFCLQSFITAGTLPFALLLHLVAGPEAGVRVGLAVDAALGVVVPDFSHKKLYIVYNHFDLGIILAFGPSDRCSLYDEKLFFYLIDFDTNLVFLSHTIVDFIFSGGCGGGVAIRRRRWVWAYGKLFLKRFEV